MKKDKLEVIETREVYYVAYANEKYNWVAKFDKTWPEAKEWAYNMVETYNGR